MPKPFDATLKELIRRHPADWLAHLGVPVTHPPEVLSADLSAVTAAADTLLKVGDRVIHIDVEAGPDDELARRMLVYNVLAHRHTGLPVRSVAVLLRSNAQRASHTDRVEYEGLSFRFDVVRVWEIPAEQLVRGVVGLMPLAVLGQPPPGLSREGALPDLVQRIAERAEHEAPESAADLLVATYILAGMHSDRDLLRSIFERVVPMEDNVAIQMMMEEGELRHARRLILRMGKAKFGAATPEQAAKVNAIGDIDRLDRLVLRVAKVGSWDALLRGR